MNNINYFNSVNKYLVAEILDIARNPNARLVCKRFKEIFDNAVAIKIWNSLKKEKGNKHLTNRILNVEMLGTEKIGFYLLCKFFDYSKRVKFSNIENEARKFQDFLDVNFSKFFSVNIDNVPTERNAFLSQQRKQEAAQISIIKLPNLYLETLPIEMKHFSNIEEINISFSRLSIVNFPPFLNLKNITISGNKEDLYIKLAELKNLEQLLIRTDIIDYGAILNRIDKGIILSSLSHLTKLRDLIIREGAFNHKIKNLDVSNLVNLKKIILFCNGLIKIDLKNNICLEKIKISCIKMKDLDISHCTRLKNAGIAYLDKAPDFSKLTNLTDLRLFGLRICQNFASILFATYKTLRYSAIGLKNQTY